MRYLLSTLVLLCILLTATSQHITREEYIETYYPIAVKKMITYKIPASITLAQGILESGTGNSSLAQKANNHFGIKCHSDWTGEGYYMDDDAEDECFRVYANPEESYSDHSEFLTTRARYKFLFTDYAVDDYKGWAEGLKKAGYATNPNYPKLLISIIEKHELFKYDEMGLLQMSGIEPVLAVDNNDEMELINADFILPKNSYYVDKKKDVFIYNRVKTVRNNDRSLLSIANQYNIDIEKLKKYNDAHDGYSFESNQFVYLQPKRKKGTESKHQVENGQTMWEISQLYAIKIKKLYKKNNMVFGEEAAPGSTLYLKKKNDKKPKTITYKDVLDEKNKVKAAEEAAIKAKQEAEQKAKEAALQKQIEEEIAIQKAKAEEAAKKEMEEREQKALEMQNNLENPTEQFDAEQHPPIKEDTIEKAPDEDIKVPDYQEATVKTYTVKAGDTLYSLSNRFYITVEKLKELNNLSDNNLRIGQVLIVSP